MYQVAKEKSGEVAEVLTMDQERLNELWSDPQNYRGSVYHCKNDPRVVVKKRTHGTGWTVNFAHSRAWWVLASMPLLALLPVAISLLILPRTVAGVMGAILLGGALVVTEVALLNARTD